MQSVAGRWSAAFHSRDFRLLWSGELISAVGTEMFYVALNWQMYLLTHSALALGLLGMANFLPIIFFSLLGGIVADAHNRKKILYVTQPIIAPTFGRFRWYRGVRAGGNYGSLNPFLEEV